MQQPPPNPSDVQRATRETIASIEQRMAEKQAHCDVADGDVSIIRDQIAEDQRDLDTLRALP
jgi:hypothetical protein